MLDGVARGIEQAGFVVVGAGGEIGIKGRQIKEAEIALQGFALEGEEGHVGGAIALFEYLPHGCLDCFGVGFEAR